LVVHSSSIIGVPPNGSAAEERCIPESTRAVSVKRRSNRRSSVLEEAPFIDLVPEPHVKGMSILAVITARDFDPLALVLPGERFRGSHERATNTSPPMTL
jgi:hypothetical protein